MRLGRCRIVALGVVVVACLGGCRKHRPAQGGATPTPAGTPTPAVLEEESDNAPPKVVKVALSPSKPTVRDDIHAVVETRDPDGDYVSVTYRWKVNGKLLLGQIVDTLPAGTAVHGDSVQVEVTPHDARGNAGEPFFSETIAVRNSPPELREQLSPGQSVDGYRMKVEDPDGDPISFSLENAPPSMRIDTDGTIRWTPSAGDRPGLYKVKMVASDGRGASVTVVFPVQVTPPG